MLAYGANVFNMAFVMPMVGYARLPAPDAGNVSLTSPRRALAAGIGGYVGLNAAALCAAIEFGVQPTLFHSADGTPLYAPFHLGHTIPAMALAHLTVAGVVEVVLTAGVIAYLQRANLPSCGSTTPALPDTDAGRWRRPRKLGWRWALIGLGDDGACSRRSGSSRRAAHSARTPPRTSTCRSTTSTPCRAGSATTPGSGTTRCSTATASATTSTRRSATSSRRSSASPSSR